MEQKERKESVVIFESWHKFMKQFPPEEYVKYMDYIMEYAIDGKEPIIENPVFFGFFWGIKAIIDANNKRWFARKKSQEEKKKLKIKTSDGKIHENIQS